MNDTYRLCPYEPKEQIETLLDWFDGFGSDAQSFFKGVIFNLNLLRFYRHKFGDVDIVEFAKFVEER